MLKNKLHNLPATELLGEKKKEEDIFWLHKQRQGGKSLNSSILV